MKTYCKSVCVLCGRVTSSAGFAVNSHMRKHEREGYYIDTSIGLVRTRKLFDREQYQRENVGPKDNPYIYKK